MIKNEPNCSSVQESKIKTRRTRAPAIVPGQPIEWLRIPALLFSVIGTLGLSKALSLRAAGLLKAVNLPYVWICLILVCAAAFLYATTILALRKESIGEQAGSPDSPEKVRAKYRWRSF